MLLLLLLPLPPPLLLLQYCCHRRRCCCTRCGWWLLFNWTVTHSMFACTKRTNRTCIFQNGTILNWIGKQQLNLQIRAALTYSAWGYDSAACCSKMSHDAFLSEALYEVDKALEKFAWKVHLKSSLQNHGSVHVYKMADGADGKLKMYVYFVILHNMSINGLHLCLRLLCRV